MSNLRGRSVWLCLPARQLRKGFGRGAVTINMAASRFTVISHGYKEPFGRGQSVFRVVLRQAIDVFCAIRQTIVIIVGPTIAFIVLGRPSEYNIGLSSS